MNIKFIFETIVVMLYLWVNDFFNESIIYTEDVITAPLSIYSLRNIAKNIEGKRKSKIFRTNGLDGTYTRKMMVIPFYDIFNEFRVDSRDKWAYSGFDIHRDLVATGSDGFVFKFDSDVRELSRINDIRFYELVDAQRGLYQAYRVKLSVYVAHGAFFGNHAVLVADGEPTTIDGLNKTTLVSMIDHTLKSFGVKQPRWIY